MEDVEIREEIQRIRDWRHKFANDMSKWQQSVDDSLRQMKTEVATVTVTVAALSKVAAANEAVAFAIAKQGPVLHMGWITKAIGLAAALSAVGGFIVVLVHYI